MAGLMQALHEIGFSVRLLVIDSLAGLVIVTDMTELVFFWDFFWG